jgi:hypothetical protein
MSVSSFLICAVTVENGVAIRRKLGFVFNGKKLSCDAAIARCFPANTRARADLLKACKWCVTSKFTPVWLEAEVGRLNVAIVPIKEG